MTKIIILLVLIAMSAFFSATETAFSSLNRIRVKNLADNGDRKAKAAMKLVDNFDNLLSAILIGNNIVNIAATSIATVLFIDLWGDKGATMATVIMTVAVLVFGEISPKSLAKESPESFAMAVAFIMRVVIFILTPLVYIFVSWKKLLKKIIKPKEQEFNTEDELITIVDEAEEEGGLDEQESDLIRSAINFNDCVVGDIFTPRVDIVAVAENATSDEIGEIFRKTNFARLPVFKETVDNIVGVIHQKDFYSHIIAEGKPLESIIKTAPFVVKHMPVADLLRLLQEKKVQMAVVVDEYGGTIGIITMEDILEELVGEIWDEHDEIVEEIVDMGANIYKVLGSVQLEKFFETFEIEPDDDDEPESSSVGGWVAEHLGKIADEGDTFEFENLKVTVTTVNERRVVDVKVEVFKTEQDDD